MSPRCSHSARWANNCGCWLRIRQHLQKKNKGDSVWNDKEEGRGRREEGVWLWGGGAAEVPEVVARLDRSLIIPRWPWLPPWRSTMSQQQMDVSKNNGAQTNKGSNFYVCAGGLGTAGNNMIQFYTNQQYVMMPQISSVKIILRWALELFLRLLILFKARKKKTSCECFLILWGTNRLESTGNSPLQINDGQCFVFAGFEN